MLGLLIVAGVTGVLVASTLIRVALKQRGTARAIAAIRDYERRAKEAAVEATLVGTQLGTGHRSFHHVLVESAGFELRLADGTIVPVAAGARVDLITPAAQVTGNAVTVPEGTRLRFLRPEAAPGAGPHQTPAGLAYVHGDALMLFSADATLFGLPARQRETSVVRMVMLVAITAVLITMCAVFGPNTRWNALLFVELVAVGMDQLLLKGLVSWALLTRAPPPIDQPA